MTTFYKTFTVEPELSNIFPMAQFDCSNSDYVEEENRNILYHGHWPVNDQWYEKDYSLSYFVEYIPNVDSGDNKIRIFWTSFVQYCTNIVNHTNICNKFWKEPFENVVNNENNWSIEEKISAFIALHPIVFYTTTPNLSEETLDNVQQIEQQNAQASLGAVISKVTQFSNDLALEQNVLIEKMFTISTNQAEQIKTLTTQYEEISLAKILSEDKLQKANISAARLLKQNSDLSKQIDSLKQRLTTTGEEIAFLKKRLTSTEDREKASTQLIKNAEASGKALRTELQNTKLNIDKIQKEKKDLETKLTLNKKSLDESTETYNRDLKKLNEEIQKLTTDNEQTLEESKKTHRLHLEEIQKLTIENNDLKEKNLNLPQPSKQIPVNGKLKQLLKNIFTKRTLVELVVFLGLLSFYNQKLIVSYIS